MSKPETITIDGQEYLKFIRFPSPVTDGTVRCISCGQIDEQPWHDAGICAAEHAKMWLTRPTGGSNHGE